MITAARMLALAGGLGLLGLAPSDPGPARLDPVVPQRIRLIASQATPGGANVTSLQVFVPSGGVPVGHRLVAHLATGVPPGTVSAKDARGNTWTLDAEQSDNALLIRAVVLSAHVTQPLAQGDAITVQFPGVANAALIVEEYAGVAPGNAVDKKAGKSGVSTTASSPVVGTAGPNEVLIGLVATRGKADSITGFGAGSGWTMGPRQRAQTRWAIASHRVAGAPANFTTVATLGVSTSWVAVIVAYRPAEQAVRADPTTPSDPIPTVATTTDLGILVLNASTQWVKEMTVSKPVALKFNWTRPALRAGGTTSPREALIEKAQWQMVAGSSASTAGVFLPSPQVGTTGLPMWALYSYGALPVATPGSSATFTIPVDRVPAQPLASTLWVRVVVSESSTRLRASPWVKISFPLLTAGVEPDPIPLSIVLAEIECVRETDDASPEDEISAAVLSVDLTTGGYGLVYTDVYDFDEDDPELDNKLPNVGVWGPMGTYPNSLPRPIASPDAAVVIVELIEHDGSGVSLVTRTAIKSIIGPKVAELRAANLPRDEIIAKLRDAFRNAVESFVTEPSASEIFGAGWNVANSDWDFSSNELARARSGEVVEKVLTFETTLPDEIIPTVGGSLGLGDDSYYRVRLRMSRQVVSTR